MANPKIQLRHDTSTNWQTQNPVLLEGEVAIETDSNKVKIGNGTDNYNTLPYITDQTKINLDYSNADYQPVNKSGDTMTGDLTIRPDSSPYICLQNSNFTKGTNPSSNIYWEYRAEDSNTNPAEWYTNRVGNFVTTAYTDGTVETAMFAYQNNQNANTAASIYTRITSAGVASCNFPNTTRCDGQFIPLWRDLISVDTSLNGSSELPYTIPEIANKGFFHMALITMTVNTGASSGNYVNGEIRSYISNMVSILRVRTRTASTMTSSGSCWIPVGVDGKIYVNRNTSWDGSMSVLRCMGYRRIGYNENA